MADVDRLMQPDAALLEGAITGRALYDGRIDAQAALKLVAGRSRAA
jgi:phosphoribosylformimino-5-aminoimidazole carboxamide ribotide isomerase